MGNMKYLEICEITPKRQCHNCMTYRTKRRCILYLRNMLATFRQSSKTKKRRLHSSVDSQCIIKKGPSHGARHGNTERQRIHHAAHLSSKKVRKKKYESILDRFLNGPQGGFKGIRWKEGEGAPKGASKGGFEGGFEGSFEGGLREGGLRRRALKGGSKGGFEGGLENGLIPCGKESHKGRQAVFFTPLDPFGCTIHPKVHYHSHWKRNQGTVYRVKLLRAKDQGLQSWQTKSFAIITYNIVPTQRTYNVISNWDIDVRGHLLTKKNHNSKSMFE